METKSWLLVANSSAAKFYKVKNMDTIIELDALIHPESRLPERELVSSEPGRTFDSTGKHRHAMEPTSTQKENEFEEFAKTISNYLENAVKNGSFTRLYVAAGPSFLGILRKHFHPQVSDLVDKEVSKDLVHADTKQLSKELFG